MTASVSVKSPVPRKEYVPWILGQACPEHGAELVMIVPESYVLRLRLDVPTAILARPEALLYAVEDSLPSIEGRDALVLNVHPSSQEGKVSVELLVYPRKIIEQAVGLLSGQQRLIGAMVASEWWGVSLPSETAMWADDGNDAWIRLPSGRVLSVNRCVEGMLNGLLWIHEQTELIKGVICYGADPELIESSIRSGAWPESVRWRVLPLAALYEAPRDHSECWDLITRRKWSALFLRHRWGGSFPKMVKWGAGALILGSLAALLFPMFQSEFVQMRQHIALKEAWERRYVGKGVPSRIEVAWNESIGYAPLLKSDAGRVPHMDPLGVWAHINRVAVWLSLPTLSKVRYEGQRWWLSWPSVVPQSQLVQFKEFLTASGWRVDISEEEGGTRVVIASSWVE